ncbi:hypothetical protein Tco_0447953 [Tanacetum coccineum]
METEAIDNQANLVNYDNENEIDDLGYQSEEYIEDAHEDDENNHSNGYAKRGITRLCKFRREYGKPGGVKLSVTFDALNRISGKHRALFLSFLGDMVREHIGLQILSWKKVGPEARNKLWDEIMRYFDVDLTVRKLVKYAKAKMARSKCVFPHTMGRGGYAHVKEKMVRKREVMQEEWERWSVSRRDFESYSNQTRDVKVVIERHLDAARTTEGMVSPVGIHPINSSTDEEGGTTVVRCNQNDASIQKEMQKRVRNVKSMGAKYTTRSTRKDSSSQDS